MTKHESSVMLSASHVSVGYDATPVVEEVSFSLAQGEIGCLLGPSGCGKTSLLKAIAGFVPLLQGEIRLREKQVSSVGVSVPVEKRHIGMVFQDFALFPHLSVADNIAFGLTTLAKQKRQETLERFASMVGLADEVSSFPHQLSGGQQQRVAIARALAPEPDVLLLDEPFSSLDTELRKQLAEDVRQILKQTGTTALMVTHDQHEAFAIADKVGVVQGGALHQWDSPFTLYHQPKTQFVAEFIGEGVLLDAQIRGQQIITALGAMPCSADIDTSQTDRCKLLVRPDDIQHVDESNVKATVVKRSFRGASIMYTLQINGSNDQNVLCLSPSHHDHQVGEQIGIHLDLEHLVIFTSK